MLTLSFLFISTPTLKKKKKTPQVVHTVATSEIEKQAVYCRCWKSGTVGLLSFLGLFS